MRRQEKIKDTELEIIILTHGKEWWKEQGIVSCPDCKLKDFIIEKQSSEVCSNKCPVDTHHDAIFTAYMRCKECACTWVVSKREKDVILKKEESESGWIGVWNRRGRILD